MGGNAIPKDPNFHREFPSTLDIHTSTYCHIEPTTFLHLTLQTRAHYYLITLNKSMN